MIEEKSGLSKFKQVTIELWKAQGKPISSNDAEPISVKELVYEMGEDPDKKENQVLTRRYLKAKEKKGEVRRYPKEEYREYWNDNKFDKWVRYKWGLTEYGIKYARKLKNKKEILSEAEEFAISLLKAEEEGRLNEQEKQFLKGGNHQNKSRLQQIKRKVMGTE